MNNHFTFKRFSLLLNKHSSEQLGTYSMAVVVLFGIMVSIVLFLSITQNGLISTRLQRDMFMVFLFASGTVFTSNSFADLGNKRKASVALMLPTSHFEKFLVTWIYSYIVLQILYVAVFYLVMFVSSSIMQIQGKASEIFSLTADLKYTTWVFLIFMALHSVAFAGSVYFEKLHYIKTALLFFGIFMLIILLNRPVIELMLGRDIFTALPFSRINVMENGERFFLDITKEQNLFLIPVPVMIAVTLWTATYHRLKEKEI